MSAHEALSLALADLADKGRRPPCSGNPERWTSDSQSTRDEASDDCAGCLLLAPCRAAGDAETFHVWGAADRTRASSPKRVRREGGP